MSLLSKVSFTRKDDTFTNKFDKIESPLLQLRDVSEIGRLQASTKTTDEISGQLFLAMMWACQ